MTFNISFGLDPLAGAIAVAALYIALREAKRGNEVLLKVQKCSTTATQSLDENQSKLFNEFSLIVKNTGISLHDVCLTLEFIAPNGHGTLSISLPNVRGKRAVSGEFAKGMLAEFGIKSYQLDVGSKAMLLTLKDPAKQEACLSLYSQDYIAKRWRLGTWKEAAKWNWNKLVGKVNYRLCRTMARDARGVPVVKYYNLPTFMVLTAQISRFLEWTQQELDREAKPTNSIER